MNLVKWLRKNNKRVMAVVVNVILFMFIGGGTFIKTLQKKQSTKRIGSYADGRKFSVTHLQQANQDLEILRRLGIQQFLSNPQDIHRLLLGELLFGERRPNPAIAQHLAQMIRQNQFRITEADLTKIYGGNQLPSIYWFLLKNEAQEAGIAVPPEVAQNLLTQMIQSLYQGADYSQYMRQVMASFGQSEGKILQVVADLLAVLQYAQLVCSAEDTTALETRHLASRDQESVDVNCVRLDGRRLSQLVDSNDAVTDTKVAAQFDRYKAFVPGSISAENPHGFGYKLPPRVQLDYMLVRLGDIESQIEPPTQQETEDYYRRYIDDYTSEQRTDPNDQESPTVKVVQGYAEVVDNITKRLIAEKVIAKADALLSEAKGQLTFGEDLTVEERRAQIQEKDYDTTAKALQVKHGIPVHTGRTGLMSLENINQDSVLRRLSLSGRDRYPIPLSQILFSMDPINVVDLQTMTQSRPRLYDNVGPLKDRWAQQRPTTVSGLTMGLVRVVHLEIPEVPAHVNIEFDRTGARLATVDPNTPRETFTVRAQVEKDLETLAGFERAQTEGTQLLARIQDEGWDTALAELNGRLGKELNPQDPNNVFALQTMRSIRRSQVSERYLMQKEGEHNPMTMSQYRYSQTRSELGQKLYDMVPQDAESLEEARLLVFPPENSVYLIKDISLKRLTKEDYEKSRPIFFLRESFIQSQSLAVEHFRPENIVQRNQFAWDETKEKEQESDEAQP